MDHLTSISACALAAGLMMASGACAHSDRRTAEERTAAEQRAYAESVVGQLYECVTVEGRAHVDTTAVKRVAPAIAKICSCYIDADFSEPSLHTLRLTIDASGSIRDVRDSAYADASQFGSCPASSLRGLMMPRPPGSTILDVRLSDLVLAP